MNDDVVYVVREFTHDHKHISIYGVYKTEEGAVEDLRSNQPGVEFDNLLWTWEDRANEVYYRIDAYTLR